ncbi:MAG: type I methionyl aminopeptidase [Chloroflexota bacterium]
MIIRKSRKEIALMRQAGRILAQVLAELKEQVKPEVTTHYLETVAASELRKHHVQSAFRGYRGFPGELCVSVNDEIVHGIPGDRLLKEGDVVSLDAGVVFHGYIADAAITVPVGHVAPETQRLLKVTETSLEVGISRAVPGGYVGDIGAAVQGHVESHGFSVVREYSGHGVGRDLHEEPLVPNVGSPCTGPLLEKGMTLAIEPMVNAGGWKTRLSGNGWTVLSADGSLSAHFEHTVVVTDGGAEVLTQL